MTVTDTKTEEIPSRPLAHSNTDGLRALGFAMVLALLGQLVLGMMNTFWLSLPESGAGWKAASPGVLLGSHMMFGTLVLVLAIWIAATAFRRRSRLWLAVSGVGTLGIVVAFGAGTAFMNSVSNDGASFAMALGCVLAIASYAYGLFAAQPRS